MRRGIAAAEGQMRGRRPETLPLCRIAIGSPVPYEPRYNDRLLGVITDTRRDYTGKDPTPYKRHDEFFTSQSLREGASSNRPTLTSWEVMGAVLRDRPDLVSLGSFEGGTTVGDILKKLLELCKASIAAGVNVAQGTWDRLSSRSSLEDALPLHQTQARTLNQLRAHYDLLVEHMADSTIINERTRRQEANGHSIPPSILLHVYEIIKWSSELACAYDHNAWNMRKLYEEEIKSHEEWFRKFLDHFHMKLSARVALQEMKKMNEGLMTYSRKCAQDGCLRATQMARCRQLAAPPTATSRQQPEPLKKKQKAARGDGEQALSGFQHNGNPPQERAAARERGQTPAEHKKILSNLPKNEGMRMAAIKDGLCKFYWMPEFTCQRAGACHFTHMTQAETRAAGITDEEIGEVFRKV